MLRRLMIAALIVTLAACGGAKKDEGAGTAAGEILPGSASDAMLPLDTVRSQAPLAPKAEGGAKDTRDKDKAAATDSPSADAAEPAAAKEPAAAEEG